ncbi:MAG: sigma 54-interacting transcriptional regulator [Bdellovibrionota bacterium]
MRADQKHFHFSIVGSADFVRRMSAAARQKSRYGDSTDLVVYTGNLAEAKALAIAHRPNALLVDIGFRTSASELEWLRSLLIQLRERFGRDIYLMVAVTTPEKFVSGGTLLFHDEGSLAPSGLIDNFLISPPPGVPTALSLEAQLQNCLAYIIELAETNAERKVGLPALWEDNWVPSMCDPDSRDVWMRWLPRYSRYVNENPLIVGPTGSGKTRLAAAMHQLSGRKGPFVSITPRDFSSMELVQAELFGAVAGAYTGAVEKWGLVAKAERGTLFIDELQSIDRDLQGKLITFVENKTYRRVGEAESHQADVRFVFATNRSLQELVDEGSLRDDFAYRLERLQLTLKPLHERRLDISAGICFALGKVLRERAQARGAGAGRDAAPLEGITPDAYRQLFAAQWPGNLRQLENTIAKLVELADIKNQRLIDSGSIEEAMEGILGRRELSADDVFANAAKAVTNEAQTDGFESLAVCAARFTELARLSALDVTGGDVKRASELIHDSEVAMNLFAKTRTTYQ